MRVLILDCGRGINPAKVATWHDKLGLRPEDDVALLSWHKPAEPLPLVAHLVAGPSLTLGREPVPHPTAPAAAAALPETQTETETETETKTEAEIETVAAEPDLGGEELSEQLTDPARLAPTDAAPHADGIGAAEAPAPAGRPRSELSALPRTHPRRLAHGLGWRVRRGRLAARRVSRSSAELAELPSHVVRTAFRRRGSGIPNEFAVSVLTSRRAARLFGGADVVVPVDALSTRAAWLLARREPRPDVIVTFQAAERVIAQRRAAARGTAVGRGTAA